MKRPVLAVAPAIFSTVAAAESYSELKSAGYATSHLTKSGFSQGWFLTKGSQKYFCKFKKVGDHWKYDFANQTGTPKARHVGGCSKK